MGVMVRDQIQSSDHAIASLRGRTVVVKYGGDAMEQAHLKEGFSRDIAALRLAGVEFDGDLLDFKISLGMLGAKAYRHSLSFCGEMRAPIGDKNTTFVAGDFPQENGKLLDVKKFAKKGRVVGE